MLNCVAFIPSLLSNPITYTYYDGIQYSVWYLQNSPQKKVKVHFFNSTIYNFSGMSNRLLQ